MKIIITTAIAALMGATSVMAGPARSASLENLRVKGVLMYDNDKNDAKLGLYSYSVTNPVERRLLTSISPLYANGGSVAIDNKLYTFYGTIDYGWVNTAYYYVYDLTTGERIKSTSMGYDLGVCYSHMATSSAVDPTDGTVYCSGYEYNEGEKLLYTKLKTWDVDNNAKTVVGDMQAPLIAMAFDNDGQLWGITSSSSTTSTDGGFLVKVDKATGNQTLIGDTGVRPFYDQCAIINPADGTFYWFANTQTEQAAIYTVDLTTAKATYVGDFPNGDEVVAPTINPSEFADNAPSAPSNLTLTPSAPYNVEIAFDMPSTTYDGSAIAGDLSWTITVKGTAETTLQGTAAAGARVSQSVALDASQQAEVSIAAASGSIAGPEAVADVYIGYDKMKAVGNLKLTHADGVSTLSWDAPAEGYFNGLTAAEGYRYIVRRMPDNIVVAPAHDSTTYTETIDDDTLRSTFYTVTTVNGDVEGDAASSNSVVTGSAINPPYAQDFDLANALDLYTIVDANNDANTWYYSVKSAKYRQSTTTGADDYLFTPCFNLKSDCSYELSFDGYGTNARYINLVDVVLATAPTAEAATPVTTEPFTYANTSTSVDNHKVIISPATDGKYYIGFHLTSEKSMGTFTIDNVVLSAGKSTAVPAEAAAFKVTAGDEGALSTHVSVVAPVATAAGDPLADDAMLSLSVKRGDSEVYAGEAAPGAVVEFDDTDIAEAGNYTYTATFANDKGAGEPLATTLYVGVDAPVAPAEVTITDNNNGTALVSWTQSIDGVNGGFVNPRNVVYNITDAAGRAIIKGGIRAANATIDIPADGAQALYSVKVAASYSDEALTPATASNEILSGLPYSLPYVESFSGAAASTSPWIKEVVSGKSSDTSWAARADNTQDNDGGAADMTAYSAAASRWAGPKIDISNAAEPVVSAYVYLPGGNTILTLQAQKDNGEWVNLASVDNAPDDWVEVTAPLTEHKSKNVRLGLLGECLGGMKFIYVDNIRVTDKSSGLDTILAGTDGIRITTANGIVTVDSSTTLPIAVYTADGRLIATRTAARATFTLTPGAYLIKAGTQTAKIIL